MVPITGKIPTEDTCKFDDCGGFSNGVAWVEIGSNKYHINTLGFRFNTKNETTAKKMNKQLLKDFPEHSMKRYLLEKFL